MNFLDNFCKKSFSCRRLSNIDSSLQFCGYVKIIYVNRGFVNICVDKKTYKTDKSDVIMIFPYQIHYAENASPDAIITEISFEPDFMEELREVFNSHCLPSSKCEFSANVHEKMKFIFDVIDRELSGDADVNVLMGYAMSLTSVIVKNIKLKKRSEVNDELCGRDKDDVYIASRIVSYCEKHYTENIHITDIAENLYITRAKVSSVMNRVLNTGFCSYINKLRISRACRLIDSGAKSMTEIAFSSGFDTIRTFNRTFKSVVGVTPSVYRKRINNIS